MTEDRFAEFRSQEWINALRQYATGLRDWLSADLSRLSDTGIRLEKAERLTLMVQEVDLQKERQGSWRSESQAAVPFYCVDQGSIAPPVQDWKLLNKWIANGSGPLLLLAPFGSGKSILLAVFTCQLAQAVVDWCDGQGKGIMPLVPLSVRLRAWRWRAEERFCDYLCRRSQDAIDLDRKALLTEHQVERLANAGQLLPLYDGFDELADDASVRKAASNAMERFTKRFLLSARPGHGAEDIFRTSDPSQQHTLRELTVPDAEMFIRQRLKISEGHDQHPAMVAYRRAQPYINELFRRPLFLVAWCVSYEATPDHPAVTISELMDVVLVQVFGTRAFQDIPGLAAKRAADVRMLRHELGAVLAVYAEEGFGAICYPSKLDDNFIRGDEKISSIAASGWRELAVRAGLLITAGNTSYVIKTPIVEYLIGSYYAWIVRPSEDVDGSPEYRRRQLCFVGKFRRGFWWREFDDIWQYTFDQLWRGKPAEVDMAEAMVQWMLDFSRISYEAGQHAAELLPGLTAADQRPWTCHGFALHFMLPFGSVPLALDHRVKHLSTRGIDDVIDEVLGRQRCRRRGGRDLELIARRWSTELIQRLTVMLEDTLHREEWGSIADTMASCFEKMESAVVHQVVVGTLMPLLGRPEYKGNWSKIARAIGSGFARMEGAAVHKFVVDRLAPCLEKPDYKGDREAIAQAIRSGFERMENAAVHNVVVERLVPCLGNPVGNRDSRSIAEAISGGFERMESGAVCNVVVDTLVPFLDKPDYEEARYFIVSAICSGFKRMDIAAVKEVVVDTLVPCLGQPNYKGDWWSIVRAIGSGFEQMESATVHKVVVDRLIPYFDKPDCKNSRWAILDAIGSGLAMTENADVQRFVVDTLLPYLDKPYYGEAWPVIVNAIGRGFARMENGAVQQVVIDALVPYLDKPEYERAWCAIFFAIGSGFATMECNAIENCVKGTLVPCLNKPEYELDRCAILDAIGSGFERMKHDAVHKVVVDTLASMLINPNYSNDSGNIADLIGKGLERMDHTSVHQVVVNTLVPHLASFSENVSDEGITINLIAEFGHLLTDRDATQLDDLLGVASKGSYLTKIVRSSPRLRWFVRRIADDEQSKRIIYGVCGRNDPELLFDPALQCAPRFIKELIEVQTAKNVGMHVVGQELAGPSGTYPLPKFVFRRVAKQAWEAAYNSPELKPIHVNRAGFIFIAHLLDVPLKTISDVKLKFWNDPDKADEIETFQDDSIMTEGVARKVDAEIRRLRKQELSDDDDIRAEARKLLEAIEHRMKSDRFKGRSKAVGISETVKAQSLVSANIKKAIKTLRELKMSDLALHFEKHIVTSGTFGRRYVPDNPPPVWEVGWIDPTSRIQRED